MAEWKIFRGNVPPHDGIDKLPPPPPWRDFQHGDGGTTAYQIDPHAVEMVNASLYLRRPLLVTGPPGVGKSTLAQKVADELRLDLLQWSISSRSTLTEGLYQYDALARLNDVNIRQRDQSTKRDAPEDIGRYIRLGPLGAALYPSPRPCVLLIDEIDKSDIDLPNDLLHVFEKGRYEIPELVRRADEVSIVEVFPAAGQRGHRVTIEKGVVQCTKFPIVILTSNGERELPPPFLRRCLQLDIEVPSRQQLRDIVTAHLGSRDDGVVQDLVDKFVAARDAGSLLATDQLLNAVFLLTQPVAPNSTETEALRKALLRELGQS